MRWLRFNRNPEEVEERRSALEAHKQTQERLQRALSDDEGETHAAFSAVKRLLDSMQEQPNGSY